MLEWEFNDDPAAITIWIDGERLANTMNGEKVDWVKFAWPKGSTTTSGLVGGFREFGFGARVWGARRRVSMSITTTLRSAPNASARRSSVAVTGSNQ